MRYLPLALSLLCASCASTHSASTPSQASVAQGGTSIQTAIPIKASNTSEGIRAEHAWLAGKHPGFKLERQALLHHGKKSYDEMEITTTDGKRMTYYFDITSFFGKW